MCHGYFWIGDSQLGDDPRTDSRAQMRWVALGMGLGFGVLFTMMQIILAIKGRIGDELNFFIWLMLLFPISLAIAITRYRLFDIDIIIRRTLQYSLLTALLALTYFGDVDPVAAQDRAAARRPRHVHGHRAHPDHCTARVPRRLGGAG